jgi:membrane fusion protein, multidrug efflux system
MKNTKTALLLSAAALALLSCDKGEAKDKTSAQDSTSVKELSVVTATLKASSFEDWVSYPAVLRGVEDVTLGAGGGGRVLSIAEVGTRVAVGQPLCDIESERYAALLAQTQAALELAQGELSRNEANVKAGSVGKAALDNAKLNFEGARVNVFQAKRALEDSRCEAPFNGVVVSRSIEKFQTVAPGMPTLRIARTDRFEAQVSLSEADLSAYAKGTPVRFSLPSLQSHEFDGKLKSVDLVVDSKTRTALARLEVVNKDRLLAPGMAGKALLLRKVYDDVVVVPATALLRNESGVLAIVSDKGIARQRSLKLGPALGDSVVVLEGLKNGEELVVQGAFRATDGSKLSTTAADTNPEAK